MTAVATMLDSAVAKLGTVSHVVEVKAPYVLVHASPTGLAAIVALGYSVSPAKRGPEYYAVKVGNGTPKPANDTARPSSAVRLVPSPRPQTPPRAPRSSETMDIGSSTYEVVETPTKRKVDVRRWEVSKGDGSKPYVVTFQTEDGERTACSCNGGIYHKHCKHMDALRAAYGANAQRQTA